MVREFPELQPSPDSFQLCGYTPAAFLVFDDRASGSRRITRGRSPILGHAPLRMAAKLLFLVVFIHLPVFVAQLLLLNRAGFPIAPNLTGLLGMQIGLGLLFLVPITLAVVTRSLAQAPLVAIGAFLVFSPLAPLFSLVPNERMSSALENSGIFKGALLLAAPVAAILWQQYARRRTWHSRTLLLAVGAAMVLADVGTPYRTLIERQYPLADSAHPAPVQLSMLPPPPPVKKAPTPQRPLGNTVLISIPVRVSAVAKRSVVLANGMSCLDGWTGKSQVGFRLESRWNGILARRKFFRLAVLHEETSLRID